ncbi:MAG: hypothetical protein MJ151_03905 [Lachnospiraceae bacterium]|nr:hypothetical protein [Lachnospiraceae bacterium]
MTEAPKERMPIKTYVLEYNDELIREAIDRELKRDGQVFIVHNKVLDIYEFADKISKIVPRAKIGVAHGQLDEKELSSVMMDFTEKKINVLVSTTIIETGIDIQNANTLIVDDADHFGMAQLYQLRGRVGRSSKTAYAFLFYKKDKVLTETSEKRLKAIKEFTSLGSGIKIAMRDLEIRGAGNVLGMSQSGHIEAIGYELYCKYLNNAIKLIHQNSEVDISSLKNDFVEGFDTTVDVDINAFIPKNYIGSDESKLDIYRKISKAEKDIEFKEIEDELKDRFGKAPIEITNLINIAKLKIKAKNTYITELTIKPNLLRVVFYEKAKIDPDVLFKIVDEFCGALHFSNDPSPTLTYRATKSDRQNIDKVIKMANYIIEKLSA